MKKDPRVIPLEKLRLNEGQLKWLPKNPRTWTQTDLDKTAKSLDEDPDFLQDRPVLVVEGVEEGTFIVFAGNLRTMAAQQLEWSEIPAVVYHPANKAERLVVKRRAMKDNGSFGLWDYDELANSWDDMPLSDWGVPAWKTEDQKGEPGAGAGASEDKFDEKKDAILVRCKPGDIWQLGEHRLMCGDSIDLEQVKALMGGVKADMVFTDPPYGVAIGDKNKMLNGVQKAGCRTENIANDTLSVDDLYKVLTKAMENVRLNCKDDASYFVCSPPGGDMGLMMMMMMRDAGLQVRHQLVWNKNAATFSLGRLDYDYKHEALMYTWTKSHHNYRKSAFRTTVWDIDKPLHNDLHPTMKPVELVAACLLDCSLEGDVVLDVFGGSGTTMIASEQLGRKCYTMEIDPHYCDVILSRWEKLTGRTAVKIN